MRLWFISALFMVTGGIVFAQSALVEDLTILPSVSYFKWREILADPTSGCSEVNEAGPLFGLGANFKLGLFDKHLTFRAQAQGFYGNVSYDGYAQNASTGNVFPMTTTVTHTGFSGRSLVGFRLLTFPVSLEPFGGIGVRVWKRDIASSAVGSQRVSGYVENWTTVHADTGLRVDVNLPAKASVYAEAGLRYGLKTTNTVNNLQLQPGNDWACFAAIGTKIDHFNFNLGFEGFCFPVSPGINTYVYQNSRLYSYQIYQPQSYMYLFTVSIGYSFI